MNPDILIVVAALNEADRISSTLAALALAFPGAPVWVADDGSTDATPELARAAAGVRAALASIDFSEPIVLLCDGDLGDSAHALPALVDGLRSDADLAVAAFATRVGGGFGLALAFARWAIRRRCGLSTRAPISGQRALRAALARDVLPFAPGFGMEIGMTIDAVRAGHRVVEVDLDLAHRATGRTPAGFLHRARQLADFIRVYFARG
jgi:hypothetical protein